VKLDLPEESADEAVGQTLGRYKLLERIGEGGCGVVYVAEQTEPVRRRVALKVIKLGMVEQRRPASHLAGAGMGENCCRRGEGESGHPAAMNPG
jgi:serine/threonine protein kinase